MKKIIKYLKKPSLLFLFLASKGFFKKMDDEKYLKICYKIKTGKELNLDNPINFNEKIQWLKINDRNNEYKYMVDKILAKKYVSNEIGEKYIIPTIGVYKKFDDIDFNTLPNEFIIKPTHTSGNTYICLDKNKINYKKLKHIINKWLKRDYYYLNREYPYKDLEKKIIIEKYMIDQNSDELNDYKFFCFNGNPKILLICSNRRHNLEETWMDMEGNIIDVTEGNHKNNLSLKPPKNFNKMKELAKILSKNIEFLRVDFYEVNEQIYFGELTFYPAGGYESFSKEEFNIKLGQMIKLKQLDRNKKNESI